MHWQYTPYTTLVFIAALISGVLTLWGWRRRPALGAGWFTVMVFSAFSWALCYGLEMTSTDLPETFLWSKISNSRYGFELDNCHIEAILWAR